MPGHHWWLLVSKIPSREAYISLFIHFISIHFFFFWIVFTFSYSFFKQFEYFFFSFFFFLSIKIPFSFRIQNSFVKYTQTLGIQNSEKLLAILLVVRLFCCFSGEISKEIKTFENLNYRFFRKLIDWLVLVGCFFLRFVFFKWKQKKLLTLKSVLVDSQASNTSYDLPVALIHTNDNVLLFPVRI